MKVQSSASADIKGSLDKLGDKVTDVTTKVEVMEERAEQSRRRVLRDGRGSPGGAPQS